MSGFGVSVKAEMRSKSWAASAKESGGEAELKSVFLHPGEMYASVEPANITIILGSCVAVCLFNERLSAGGATHYLLPMLGREGLASPRYGDVAIRRLLQELHQLGSRNKDLRAYVFGGASMLQAFRSGSSELIGNKNVELALETLERESIAIEKRDTGGMQSRKITMRTDTGAFSLKLIGN
jgi:chemotaxis protein CheD